MIMTWEEAGVPGKQAGRRELRAGTREYEWLDGCPRQGLVIGWMSVDWWVYGRSASGEYLSITRSSICFTTGAHFCLKAKLILYCMEGGNKIINYSHMIFHLTTSLCLITEGEVR